MMSKKKFTPPLLTSFDELDQAGIGAGYRARAQPEPVPKKPEERTWGEAATDTVVQLAEGVNNIAGAVPNLFAPQSGVASFFRDNADHWRGAQSEALRRKVADADAQIGQANQDSIVDQAVTAAKAYGSDPALATRFVTTNLPSMLPGVAVAKAAQVARLAGGASAAVAAGTATTAAGATNAVLNAGGARGEAFEDIRDALVKQGHSSEEAERMALERSRMPAAVGAATGFLSGKIGLEHAVVGGGARGGLAAGARSAAAELLGEQAEEVLPQVATNYQASDIDQRPLSRNVGRTAVETAIGSAPGAGVSGAMTALRRGDAPAATSEDGQPPARADTTAEDMLPDPLPEQPALRPSPTAEAADTASAVTRLAELEVIDGNVGLSAEQQAERAALANRVDQQAALEEELETIGESAEVVDSQAAAPEAGLPTSGETQAQQASAAMNSGAAAFDPAATQAKTWPQFVTERGERVSTLRKGTPEWDRLQNEWTAVKTRRAGANPEGTGATGAPTPEIQNRDRSRPASVVQMQAMAQNPDYLRLGVSRSPESGAPMVFAVGDRVEAVPNLGRADTAVMSDGQRVPFQYAVMEAGDVQPSNFADGGVNPLFDAAHPGTVKALNNGRTAGLRAAYERGTAEQYKQELMADSALHGIEPEVIARMRAPMLVRLYSERDNQANMGAKSQSQALGLSATEQAATDATLVDNAVLDAFDAGGLDSAANRDFARAFIGKLQENGQDVAGMMDAGGSLSPAGVTRLQAALVHKAYSDGDLVESMFGSTDNDIRAIGEALKDVAGEWANMRAAAEVGAVNPQVDVTGNLLQAIRLVQKARRERASLYDAINQVDMVTGDVVDSLTVGMLRLLYSGEYLTRAVGRDRLVESLRDYMGAALATRAEGDMFGEQVGPDAILSALSGQPTEQTSDAPTTEANGQPAPTAQEGERGAAGGDAVGSRAAEPGQQERRSQPDQAGAEPAEDGRGIQGQDATDQGGQPDGQGDQGAAKDRSSPVAPPPGKPKLRDTRGTGVRLHGTSRPLPAGGPSNDEVYSGNVLNIYGQGFYTTDAADIAAGYTRKGKGGEPTVYDIAEREPVRLYDMDAPMTPDVRALAERALGDLARDEDGETGEPITTLSHMFDEARAESRAEGVSAEEVQESFYAIRERLEELGYRGFTHVGGKKTGKAAHQVNIYWFPESDLQVKWADLARFEEGKELELSSYTSDEVTAREDAQQQADQERARENARADADARAERDRKEVAARMDASANSFELGQDADDALSGQKPMFSRKPSDPEARDAEYLAAVERGDMDVAQRMVDEAAKAAGYTDGTEYRMSHTAPDSESGTSLVDLRTSDLVPDDYWTRPEWYQGTPEEYASHAAVSALLRRVDARAAAGKTPGLASATMYRAVPKGVKDDAFRNGDWITPSEAYARSEGAMIPGGYRIVSMQVSAENLWWDGNSIAELGYDNGQRLGYKNTKNNRKRLDPVTRDDDGAVIPLSKRFNSRSSDVRFSFAGQTARTADMTELQRAKDMAARGVMSARIQAATGWHRGVDGRWRFEISDDKAAFRQAETDEKARDAVEREVRAAAQVDGDGELFRATVGDGTDWVMAAYGMTRDEAVQKLADRVARSRFGADFDINKVGDREVHPLSDVLNHPDLFQAYPFLRGFTVHFRKGYNVNGSFDERNQAVTLNANRKPAEMLSTLLHEIQHAIQAREDFARGGDASQEFASSVKSVLRQIAEGEAREVEAWKARHPELMATADKTAATLRDALKYESMERLLSYSEREKPSGVFRLIRNEMQWIYEKESWRDPVAVELQRRFYGMPKSGPKRSAYIRDMAFDAQKWLRSTIAAEHLAAFQADERTMKGLVAALRRHADKARAALQPLHEQEGRARVAEALDRKFEFGSPYDIYRALAGEVEARATQARQGLTAAERRARPVQADMDVSPAEAIVVVGGREMRLPDVQQDRGAPGPADDFDVDAFLRTMQDAPAVPDEAKAQAVARTEFAAATIRSGWSNGPEVVVAFDMADPKVPQQVRDADLSQRSRGAGGSPEGFYFGGKVYLLAQQLPREQDVARVLMHEALGHHGLAGVFGSGLDAVLKQLAQARPAEVRRKAAEHGLDYSDRGQRMQAAEEVLAEMAQTRPELGFVQRAVAAVRSWARTHLPGFAGLRMTDAEIIRDYILPARRWVERARQAVVTPAAAGSAPALAFSLPADALAQARTKWAGLVDQFVRGGLDETKTYEVLPSSTAVMKMLGLPDVPVHAGVHAMDALYNHGVKPSQMKQILDELANPRMVMVWNKGSRGDASLNFVTSMSNPQGQPFVIAIKPNRGSVKGRFHWVATVTEKQPRAILDMVREGGAMYAGEGAIAGISEAEMREALRFAKEKRGKEARGLMQAIGTSYSLPNLVQRVLYAKDLESFKGEQPPGAVMFSRAGGAPQTTQPAKGLLARLQERVRQLTSPEAVDSWLYNWQDKFIDLKRIQDQIKALNGTVSETNDAYRGEELYHKRVAKRTANFLRDEVRPLLAAVNDAEVGMEEFERFLHARHAPEANRVLAERNPSKQELDQKRADAAKTVADLRRQLQHARASGSVISGIQRSLGLAMAEADRWNSAEAFKGTEEDRLSLSGMSDAEAKNVMGGYNPEQRKVMDALATRVDRMNNITLQTLEQYGLMDHLSIEAWRKTYQHYIPLHRDEARPDSKGHPIGQGFSTKGDASKRRTGSNEKVTNILGHLVMQREAALTRGEKNNVMKRLYVLAAQNPDESLWSLELPKKKAIDPDTGLVRTMPDIGARLRDNVLTLRIGGKDKHIIFNERNERAARLAIAMKNLDATELDRFTRTMGHLTRWFAAVNTQYNPIFGVLNLARDVQGSLLQLSSTPLAGRQREVFKNIRSNMGAIYQDLRRERRESGGGQGPWARLWEQLQLDGGTTGYRDLYTKPEDRAAALRKALEQQSEGRAAGMARGVGEWLSDFNETLEASTRLAVYKAALDAGQSREAAASLAKNITVNFNRKGRNTSVVGSYYAFLNAAIQGNVRMLETLAGPAGRKVMAGGVALGMLSGLAGALIMGGGGADDEWKKIPDFVKERSIIIPLSRQDYVAIPMPLGFHVFPNIGRKLVEFGMHDDPTKSRAGHLADMAMIALNAYNPLGGADNIMQMLAPTPFDPVVALMENKDWTGRQIYKEQRSALDPKPGHAMGKDSVTPPARWVARLINDASGGNEWQPGKWSPNPDALEYLFGQFTGGVGRELTKAGNMVTAAVTGEELAPHQITLAGRFYGDTRGVNGQSTSYYENLKRVNTSMAEAKGRVQQGEDAAAVLLDVPLAKVDGPANVLDKRVSDLVKMRKQIQKSDSPNKRELVKEVNLEIEQSMYLLNKAVEDTLAERRDR